jgi:hypothetical protein
MSVHAAPNLPQDDFKPPHPLSASPTAPLFVWRCATCLRRETFGMMDLHRYANAGWPMCCGQVVLAFPESRAPGRQGEGGAVAADGE